MERESTSESDPTDDVVRKLYVGYCDVLGFASQVLKDFSGTLNKYKQFASLMRRWPTRPGVRVSVYSDSIAIVGEALPDVLHAVVSVQFAALSMKWLVRGAVTYGNYWEDKIDGHLFVVSDAWVKAVKMEATVTVPAVVLSDEIELGLPAWVPRFEHGPFRCSLLYFDGRTIVNPFNEYWFNSAVIRVNELKAEFPAYAAKYEWFLALAEAVRRDEVLVPPAMLQTMLNLGILTDRHAHAPAVDPGNQ